jgi:hypothetical protein
MGNKLIAAGILFAIYKWAPNQAVKAMALGVAGVMAANYVPYVNGKDVAATIASVKVEAA